MPIGVANEPCPVCGHMSKRIELVMDEQRENPTHVRFLDDSGHRWIRPWAAVAHDSRLWGHVLCAACFMAIRGQEPQHRVIGESRLPCCGCGIETGSGIYLWHTPALLACKGSGGPHDR